MNIKCPYCNKAELITGQVVRHSTFFRKSQRRKIRRFRCKPCHRTFSTATFHSCFGQKKRYLNRRIYRDYTSLVTLRRLAKNHCCDFKTVVRKVEYLYRRCKMKNQDILKKRPLIHQWQFDDVETAEHTKCKPLSITIAVEEKTRFIIGFKVSQIAAKGKLAKISVKKYGKRKSNRRKKREELFQEIRNKISPQAVVKSDKDPSYPQSVAKYFPENTHLRYKGRKSCVVGQGELKVGGFDPIFSFNHTAAMLRANMHRLIRKTWNTTKSASGLTRHLEIYQHRHNTKLIQGVT